MERWHPCKRVQPYKTGFFLILVLAMAVKAGAQVNEPAHSSVYDYLYRMAQKGLIRWNDYQLPLDRKAIAAAMDSLTLLQEKLTRTENRERAFYQQEYAFDGAETPAEQTVFFRKDAANRWRAARLDKDGARIFVDPVIGVQGLKSGAKSTRQSFSGIRLAGYFGKRWGFNFAFRDNTEKGDTLTHTSSFAPVEGIVPTIQKQQLVNFSSFNYNIGYRWSTGSLSVGQENLLWGYGAGGNMALSGRAPSFPFIKFDFQPWPWLHFNYFHGWLQSNIIDSARTYATGSGIYDNTRELYVRKFIAHHSFTVTPFKGLDLALGESIVYSDRLNFAYLIPINFFKVYDQYNSRYNIKAGDNSQFFGFVSSRNHLKNTHVYAQVFIDEIRASKIFNRRERRNQLGYTIGLNRTDVLLPYLTVGLEYARVNPFVYNNLIPAQTYTSNTYSLGDWMGNNADRLYLFAQYVPLPKLRLKLWHQSIRKGESGTLYQQYLQEPQPPFLFQKLFDYKELGFSAKYEIINRLLASFEWNRIATQPVNAPPANATGLRLGVSYGW